MLVQLIVADNVSSQSVMDIYIYSVCMSTFACIKHFSSFSFLPLTHKTLTSSPEKLLASWTEFQPTREIKDKNENVVLTKY